MFLTNLLVAAVSCSWLQFHGAVSPFPFALLFLFCETRTWSILKDVGAEVGRKKIDRSGVSDSESNESVSLFHRTHMQARFLFRLRC